MALQPANADSLDALRWKKRLILIYAPAGADEKLAEQQSLLRARRAEVAERDLAEIVIRERNDHPEAVKRFGLTGPEFTVVLVGKDGGEKLRSNEVVQPERFFRLIDSMPMRQDEMRERKQSFRSCFGKGFANV